MFANNYDALMFESCTQKHHSNAANIKLVHTFIARRLNCEGPDRCGIMMSLGRHVETRLKSWYPVRLKHQIPLGSHIFGQHRRSEPFKFGNRIHELPGVPLLRNPLQKILAPQGPDQSKTQIEEIYRTL